MELPDRRLIEFKLYLAELDLKIKLHYQYMCSMPSLIVYKETWFKDIKICELSFKCKKGERMFDYGDLESITVYGYDRPKTTQVIKQCLELSYEVPVDIQYLGD